MTKINVQNGDTEIRTSYNGDVNGNGYRKMKRAQKNVFNITN